jgi:hypothetical protein
MTRWHRLLVLAKQRGARYQDAKRSQAIGLARALHGSPQ